MYRLFFIMFQKLYAFPQLRSAECYCNCNLKLNMQRNTRTAYKSDFKTSTPAGCINVC